MTNHTPEPTILERLNHLADGLNNLRDNSKDDYDRGYIGAEVELMISNACEEFNNANGPMHMGEPVISNPFMDKLAAVTAQRDELLAALKQSDSALTKDLGDLELLDVFKQATVMVKNAKQIMRDAIAKCEVTP